MKWIILVSLVFFVNTNGLHAQKKLDSLLSDLKTGKKKDEVKNLQRVAFYYKENDLYKNALSYFEQVLAIADMDEQNTLKAATKKEMAFLFGKLGDYKKSINYVTQALVNLTDDKQKQLYAELYLQMGTSYINISKYDSTLFYLHKAFTINSKIGNKEGMADNLFIEGMVDYKKGNTTQAIDYLTKALDLIKGTDNRRVKMKIESYLATFYSDLGNHLKATELYLDAISIGEVLDLKSDLANTYKLYSKEFMLRGELDKALEYRLKALAILEKISDNGDDTGSLLRRLADIYSQKKEFQKALQYNKKGLDIFNRTGNKSGLAAILNDIGGNYKDMGNHTLSFDYYNKCLATCKALPDSNTMCVALINIAELYLDAPDTFLQAIKIDTSQKIDMALNTFDSALSIATSKNYLQYQTIIWQEISKSNQKKGNFIKALEAYKKYVAVKDKISNDGTKNKINRLEIQYEFNKKEDSLKFQKSITDAQLLQEQFLNKQQSQNLLLQHNKLLLSQQQLALSNKEKDLQHLAFLKTQADLQTEQLQKSEKEKKLTIAEKEKELQSALVRTLSQENDLNKLRRRQQLIYGAGGIALLLFAGLFLFYHSRNRQAQLKADLEKEKVQQQKKEAEFQRSLADVSMSALRSQMNPHFIFNCLNSIKLYTSQNETAAASAYLTKFSKLIRMALENSRSETVALKAELEALDLYIQMEAMRFKDKLKYSITVEENVDSNFIEIPPLLLQPYVENAIWHGLMHKEEGGKITVGVSVVPNQSILSITIQDNGVGRVKSEQLRSNAAGEHKSYGTKVTSERLDLINKVYKTGASVITADVKDTAGEIAGTLVTIKIPFE